MKKLISSFRFVFPVFLLVGVLSLNTSTVFATSSGPNYAGTGTDQSSIGSKTWSHPEHIAADDGSNATATVSNGGTGTTVTHYLQGENFGFSIPTNATIDGIQVSINRFSSDNGDNYVNDNEVRLVKGGTVLGNNYKKIPNWPTSSSTVISYGGESDLWGTTWAPADINNPNFGVVLSASIYRHNDSVTANVDYVKVAVTFDIFVPAGTCPTTPGYAGSTDTVPNGEGGFLSCSPVPACTDSEYLSDGVCVAKIAVCTDSTATNPTELNPSTEISDNSLCTYTPAGTCPTTPGYAGSTDTVPNGEGGFLSCSPVPACTDSEYLSDGVCVAKIAVCTDSTATNPTELNPSTEISDNSLCTYTPAGTCPTTPGYAGSTDTVPNGEGGFLSCSPVPACTSTQTLDPITNACVDNPPLPTDVCPNIDGAQSTVPAGDVLIAGQCVPIAQCTNTQTLDVATNTCVDNQLSPTTEYSLTYTAGVHGSITGTSPQTVASGADGIAVTAVPDSGYQFVNWSDGLLTVSRTDKNIQANLNVTASFTATTHRVQTGSRISGGQVLGASTGPSDGGQVLGAQTFQFTKNMRLGSKGNEATELEKRLTTEGYYTGPIDGKFGKLLQAAVKAYQKANPPLKVDGIVGPLTRAVLNK